MKTRTMGIQNGFNKKKIKNTPMGRMQLWSPCLETSVTTGWVALNDSGGYERAGPKEERVTVTGEDSAGFLAELKAFQQ